MSAFGVAYRDLERQRAYQRRHVAENRARWLALQRCLVCGTREDLRVYREPGYPKPTWRTDGPSHLHLAVVCRSCAAGKVAPPRPDDGTGPPTKLLRLLRARPVVQKVLVDEPKRRAAQRKATVERRAQARADRERARAELAAAREARRVWEAAEREAHREERRRRAALERAEAMAYREDARRSFSKRTPVLTPPAPVEVVSAPPMRASEPGAHSENEDRGRLAPRRGYRERKTKDAHDDHRLHDVAPCPVHGRTRATELYDQAEHRFLRRYVCCGRLAS